VGHIKPDEKYFAPKIPVTRKSDGNRARLRARVWSSYSGSRCLCPLLVALMAYGFSDQVPASLRRITIMLDGCSAIRWDVP